MADEYDEGDWRIASLVVTPYDGTTSAALQVESPTGTLTPLVPTDQDDTPEAGKQTWTAPAYELTLPGEWIERWTVTGTGKSKQRAVVLVAPDPTNGLVERTYATTADYSKLIRKAPPVGARRGLAEASRLVDEMLLTAIYAVDEVTGLPTETEHIEALRDATCLQLEWAASSGDKNMTGAGRPSSFTLGRLSVQQPSGGSTAQRGKGPDGMWAPRAWSRLQRAGLTGYGPQTRW